MPCGSWEAPLSVQPSLGRLLTLFGFLSPRQAWQQANHLLPTSLDRCPELPVFQRQKTIVSHIYFIHFAVVSF